MCALVRHGTAGGTQTLQSSPRRVLSSSSPREAPPARPSPPNACRQTTRRASEVRRDRARASPRPATATTGAFCSIGDEAGEQMVARATDHRRRARSRSSRAFVTHKQQPDRKSRSQQENRRERSEPTIRPPRYCTLPPISRVLPAARDLKTVQSRRRALSFRPLDSRKSEIAA